MRGTPLDTKDAKRLLQIVKTSGASAIVFAGGDPSLRDDIADLVPFAKENELGVEVQTNAHFQPPSFLNILPSVNLVGLSIDADGAELHDGFRGRIGNFSQVLKLLEFLAQKGVPVIVRSLISATNYQSIAKLAVRLMDYPNITRWSLLEFTPIGEGFQNQGRYVLDRKRYEDSVAFAMYLAGSDLKVDVYRNEDKLGTYALVTPDGQLYGTGTAVNGDYPKVGSMLREHLSDLADRLVFSPERHLRRYSNSPPVLDSDDSK